MSHGRAGSNRDAPPTTSLAHRHTLLDGSAVDVSAEWGGKVSLLSQAIDYLMALIVGWPGVMLGLLVIVEWLERTFSRRRLCSSRTKLVVAAGVLIVGAITTRPDCSGPREEALRRPQQRREQYAR